MPRIIPIILSPLWKCPLFYPFTLYIILNNDRRKRQNPLKTEKKPLYALIFPKKRERETKINNKNNKKHILWAILTIFIQNKPI